MAQIRRTADHSIWFNAANFQQQPSEGILECFSALAAGRQVVVELNGHPAGIWARYNGGVFALKSIDNAAKQAWDAIPVTDPPTWVQIALGSVDVPNPAGPKLAAGPVVLLAPKLRWPETPPHAVYAIDVGAPKGGLAWARFEPHSKQTLSGSSDYNLFIKLLSRDLRAKLPVALGFEAPMFLPVANNIMDLTRARKSEPASWSAGPGSSVTAIVIPLIAHTLKRIHAACAPHPTVSLDSDKWLVAGTPCPDLFLWEAFVHGKGHARDVNAHGLAVHIQDAATAVQAFVEWESGIPREPTSVTAHDPISTVGSAVLWSGLGSDLALLHQDVLVLRPLCCTGIEVVECTEKL